MKLLKKNSESGQALVLALILLALGSLLLVPGLGLSTTSLKYHQLIEGKTLESYSADSGIEYALTKLYNDPGAYTGTPLQESFNLNNRTTSVTCNYSGGGIYKITSTATSANGRRTTIETYVNLSSGAFAYTVASKTNMSISSGATVNSTKTGGADIHANGNISLTSGCKVYGNASATGNITGWQGTVTGTVTQGSLAVDFPGDYSGLYKVLAQESGNWTGDVTLQWKGDYGKTPSNPILFPGPGYQYGYIQGSLEIKPNTCVRLTSTVYVTGTIIMQPGSMLDGQENIMAEGTITINGGTYTSPLIPCVISKNGNIACGGQGGGAIVNAVVYAPNGTASLASGAYLYGAVGGNTVNIGSNSGVTYASQLQGRQDLPGGELTTIAYSYK